MAPTSVVHVLWEGPIGGIQRLVHQIADRQASEGIEVAVAFGRPVGAFADALMRSNIAVIDLGVRSGFDVRPHVVARGGACLSEYAVVHLHGFNVPLAATSVASRRPVVFTEHGSYHLGRRLGAAKRWTQRRFLLSRGVLIAANSKYTAGCIQTHYGFGANRVEVVSNGVEFGPAPDQRVRAANAQLIVGFVGRWADVKRMDRLVEGIAHARRHADIRALLVGGGPNEQHLRRLSAELGVSDAIEFVGEQLELDQLFDRMDVIVQTGIESFGMSLVEGCGRGALPLVFADGGGAVEVLPPDGVIVDAESLGSTLVELAGAAKIGVEARSRRAAWARDHYGIGGTVAGYGRLYERALARRT